jgi:glycosyltransferase involved in cell wall biosynthesis
MEVSGRGALLVKSDDNKKKMAEDLLNNIMNIRTKPELRKEMIDKGKRNAAKYTWRKFTQNIIQAYDSVL